MTPRPILHRDMKPLTMGSFRRVMMLRIDGVLVQTRSCTTSLDMVLGRRSSGMSLATLLIARRSRTSTPFLFISSTHPDLSAGRGALATPRPGIVREVERK